MPKTRRRARVSARLKAASKASSGAESCETERETYPTPADHVAASDLSERARALSSSVADKESDVMKLAREFRALCSEHANPSNATAMEQYMRNQFTLFGIKAPQRRKLQKKFTSEHREKLASRPFLLRFAVALWRQEERECQLYGVDLMSEFRREALGETEAEFGEAVACAEVLITTKSWWDTVDMLASHSRYGHIHGNDWLENSQKLLVGYIVSQRREKGVALMEQWIAHPCMWLRRTALLHQLNYKADTDQALLFRFCQSVAHEKEFFIRKAVGWALRQCARTNGDAVRKFVEENRDSLSKLSIREATKHL